MKMAARSAKKVIVTDRVNQMGGAMEGPGSIPLRHGLTLAELARYYNSHLLGGKVDLVVVPMSGWRRDLQRPGSSDESLQGKSLLKLLREIQPVEIVQDEDSSGAILFPKEKGLSEWELTFLKKMFKKFGFTTEDCSYWSEEKQKSFRGVRLRSHAKDVNFSLFNTLIALVRFFSNRSTFSVSYSPQFDKILGSKYVRQFLQGNIGFDELKTNIEKELSEFSKRSDECFLYYPLPQPGSVQLVKN